MNVLYISGTVPDNRYTFIHREVEALRKNGVEVSFLILKPYSGKQHSSNQHTWYYPSFNPFSWLVCPFLNLLIFKRSILFSGELYKILKGIDLKKTSRLRTFLGAVFLESALYSLNKSGISFSQIHSHHLFAATLFTPAISKCLHTNYSLTLHTLSHYYTEPFLKDCIQNALFTRTVTRETYGFAGQFKNTQVVYIPNSISIDSLLFKENPTRNSNLILAIGKLLDKKGFDILVKSCKILSDKKVDFNCMIIGEGPEHDNLENLISQNNLGSLITLHPFKEFKDLIQDFLKAAVLAMPSKNPSRSTRDGLPTVILEAMALNLPVVATNFAGISDAITDNETGLLVESNNEKQLADGLQRILDDKKLANRLTANAYQRVKNNYSLEKNMWILSERFKNQLI